MSCAISEKDETNSFTLENDKKYFQFSDVWKTTKKVISFAIALFGDLLMIPFAGALTLFGLFFGTNMDPKPKDIKKEQTPILLIHGNGYNESQWIIGRQFLKGLEYGSVFSLNLDGLVSNKPENGMEEYAEKISDKIEEIKKLTGRDDIILIGHSMGGLVGATYTENMAEEKSTDVKKVITISTPYERPPLLSKLTSLTEKIFPDLFKKPKRYQEMRNDEGFLTRLKEKISENQETYYSIHSKSDMMVPGSRGKVSNHPEHHREYSLHGHYTPMVSVSIWRQVQKWILS